MNLVKAPINIELEQFKVFFKDKMKSDNYLLNIVLSYILKNKGKQLRPILVFLSAKLVGDINQKTHVSATLVELLHTATLVHDDVVDNSQIRRSSFSIKALWQSRLSVLVGDFLLSKGLLISVQNRAYDILEIVSKAVQDMSEGELLQIEKARRMNINEIDYFEIIKKKTSSLFVASTVAGVKSVTNNTNNLMYIRKFGLNFGIAFQIKDDILDYQKTNLIGKPFGNDIQESKLTLPLIYSLNKSNRSTSRTIRKILSKNNKTKEDIFTVYDFVKSSGGLDYAQEILLKYIHKSKTILENNFENSSAKDALLLLVDFVAQEKK